MKTFKNTFIAITILFSAQCFSLPKVYAQQKLKRHVELLFEYKTSSQFVGVAKITAGENKNYRIFNDSTVLLSVKKVEALKDLPTILNYLSDLGWTQTGLFPSPVYYISDTQFKAVRILFSKEFDPSELIK